MAIKQSIFQPDHSGAMPSAGVPITEGMGHHTHSRAHEVTPEGVLGRSGGKAKGGVVPLAWGQSDQQTKGAAGITMTTLAGVPIADAADPMAPTVEGKRHNPVKSSWGAKCRDGSDLSDCHAIGAAMVAEALAPGIVDPTHPARLGRK